MNSRRYLADKKYTEIRKKYEELKDKLGHQGASDRTADLIIKRTSSKM